MEDSFIEILSSSKALSTGISSEIIKKILEGDLNNSLAKVKRATTETRVILSEKIEALKEDVDKFENTFAQKAEEKIIELKNEVKNLEKTVSKKVESFKNFEFENEKTQKAASEAKRLGNRAWEVAKNKIEETIKSAKEAINKDK